MVAVPAVRGDPCKVGVITSLWQLAVRPLMDSALPGWNSQPCTVSTPQTNEVEDLSGVVGAVCERAQQRLQCRVDLTADGHCFPQVCIMQALHRVKKRLPAALPIRQ